MDGIGKIGHFLRAEENNFMENVSIIIPTRNRPEALKTVLNCIENLTTKAREIIIVNQGEDLHDFIEVWKDRLPILWLAQTCTNPSMARNLAIKHSKGEWILFLDDDVSFEPDLLEKYLIVFKELRFDACNGSVITPKESITPIPIPEIESGFIGLWSQLSSYRTYSGSIKISGTCSANLLVKKTVLTEIGGFDERFSRMEDVELGIRISQAGYSLWHDGRPIVKHYHLPFGGSRDNINGWINKHLSAVQPKHLGAQLLILKQYYPWNQRLILIIRIFLFYMKPSRLYLERPSFPIDVLRAIYQSIKWANASYNQGAKLAWRRK